MDRFADGHPGSLDGPLDALHQATEALRAQVTEAADPDAIEAAWAGRRIAFDAVAAAVRAGARPGPRGREALEAVRLLDAAMVAEGGELLEGLHGLRRDLARRRSALRVHGRRERSEPRALTLKA